MKRVAIIGTGIAGMSCAAELHGKYDLSIYEKNDYVGGHSHTVLVDEEGMVVPIDTGFMVYNEVTYPNLTRLFSRLGVATKPASMSFSVNHVPSGLEYSGTGFAGLFAQIKNVTRPSFWKLLMEINRFNISCGEVLTEAEFGKMTLEEYCTVRRYSAAFRDRYLIPMSSAVWSSPPNAMLEFPAVTLVRFFTNHCFLGLQGQLAWRTVVGGSRVYRDTLIKPFADRIAKNRPAIRVKDEMDHVSVEDSSGALDSFDAVVVACHADQALALLGNPTTQQRELLGAWRYHRNIATLHCDERVMPRARRAWASWNYNINERGTSTVYWMNNLQGVSKKKNYFVSINDQGTIDPQKVLRVIKYEHPLYTLEAIESQKKLPTLNETGGVYFCGSYFKYGFHEDALTSGLNASAAVSKRLQ